MRDFSTMIKKAGTDEWYTQAENVEMIVPYLVRGGIRKYFALSIKQTVIL